MRDTQLYSQILGIAKPWKVTGVQVSLVDDEVEVTVAHGGGKLVCRQCNTPCPGYDKRVRRWRHLDTCQLKTVLVAEVPRVQCPEHGVVTIRVPWAEPGSGFTALDRFHVAQYLGKAVDQVRRQEHRRLLGQGDARLKGRKYQWLRNRATMDWYQQRGFTALRKSSLKTARAWAIKEFATRLWGTRVAPGPIKAGSACSTG